MCEAGKHEQVTYWRENDFVAHDNLMNTWCCDILGHELTIVAPVAESIDGDNDDNSEERGESGPGKPRKLYDQ